MITAGPWLVPSRTSPEPVLTGDGRLRPGDLHVAGAALDPQLGVRDVDGDVAGAGLDLRRAGELLERHLAGAGLELAGADGAVDGDVGRSRS